MNSGLRSRPIAEWFVLLALSVAALVALPAAVLRKPVVELASRDAWILGLVAAGFGVLFLWVAIQRRRPGGVSVWRFLELGFMSLLFNGIRDDAARRALIEYLASPESRLEERPGLPE